MFEDDRSNVSTVGAASVVMRELLELPLASLPALARVSVESRAGRGDRATGEAQISWRPAVGAVDAVKAWAAALPAGMVVAVPLVTSPGHWVARAVSTLGGVPFEAWLTVEVGGGEEFESPDPEVTVKASPELFEELERRVSAAGFVAA